MLSSLFSQIALQTTAFRENNLLVTTILYVSTKKLASHITAEINTPIQNH